MNNIQFCQRILQHCQQQHWYAGDIDDTAHFSKRGERYEVSYTPQGDEIVTDNDPDDHPRKASFAYDPATEAQLAETEHILGFPLPTLLRMLYAQVANGGFGPGHGLIGALDGFCEAGDIIDNYQFHRQRSRSIELEDYEQQEKPLELHGMLWPHHMLYLCDWNWGAASCIDCRTGKIYLKLPSERNLYYRLELQASSLENWLDMWLHGELQYAPPKPDVPELNISDLRLFFESSSASNDNEAEEINPC